MLASLDRVEVRDDGEKPFHDETVSKGEPGQTTPLATNPGPCERVGREMGAAMKMLMPAVAGFLMASPAAADTVSNAYALCKVVDSTGLASSPCAVSGWGQSVTAVIDMNSGEARKLCGQIAGLMRDKKLSFDRGWTLQIKSPYSGSNSIAFCNLPN